MCYIFPVQVILVSYICAEVVPKTLVVVALMIVTITITMVKVVCPEKWQDATFQDRLKKYLEKTC